MTLVLCHVYRRAGLLPMYNGMLRTVNVLRERNICVGLIFPKTKKDLVVLSRQ